VPFRRHLRSTTDTAVTAVFYEDSAALAGNAIALAGLGARQLTGSAAPDAAAGIMIGVLLAAIGLRLAGQNRALLTNSSESPAVLDRIRGLLAADPDVAAVSQVASVYAGPHQLLLTAEIQPVDTISGLRLRQLLAELRERIARAIPRLLRTAVPSLHIHLEQRREYSPDRHDRCDGSGQLRRLSGVPRRVGGRWPLDVASGSTAGRLLAVSWLMSGAGGAGGGGRRWARRMARRSTRSRRAGRRSWKWVSRSRLSWSASWCSGSIGFPVVVLFGGVAAGRAGMRGLAIAAGREQVSWGCACLRWCWPAGRNGWFHCRERGRAVTTRASHTTATYPPPGRWRRAVSRPRRAGRGGGARSWGSGPEPVVTGSRACLAWVVEMARAAGPAYGWGRPVSRRGRPGGQGFEECGR